jgi:hypothetical protein
VRIFKTRTFAKFARRERLHDKTLRGAVREAEAGLVAADLGSGVIKQRMARQGQGKRGGFRVLIAFRAEDRAVFLYGFAKNERDNIDDKQLATLRDIATAFLQASDAQITKEIAEGRLQEVDDEQ